MRTHSRVALWCIGMLVLVGSASTAVYATLAPVPEIDGGTLSAGLALLTGSAMILRSRMRRK